MKGEEMEKKNYITIIILLVFAAGIVGYMYFSAQTYYKNGLEKLELHQWDEAHNLLEKAVGAGVVFFQEGPKIYEEKISLFSDEQYQQAVETWKKGDFLASQKHLDQIPKGRMEQKKKDLQTKNPLYVPTRNFIPPSVEIKKVDYGLLSPEIPMIIVEGIEGNDFINQIAHLYLLTYDVTTSTYKVGYHLAKEGWNGVESQQGKLFGDDRNAVIVEHQSLGGSGWDAKIYVLGMHEESNKLTNFIDYHAHKGSAEVINKKLMISSPDGEMRFKWNGREFEGDPIYRQPSTDPTDLSIHFSLLKSGELVVEKNDVTLKVGQKVALIRDDQEEVSFRLLFGGTGVIESVENARYVFEAKQVGEAQLTLIPNGYCIC
jgi:hypothetical protein